MCRNTAECNCSVHVQVSTLVLRTLRVIFWRDVMEDLQSGESGPRCVEGEGQHQPHLELQLQSLMTPPLRLLFYLICALAWMSTVEPLIPQFCGNECYHVTFDPVINPKGQDDQALISLKSRINNWLIWLTGDPWPLLTHSKGLNKDRYRGCGESQGFAVVIRPWWIQSSTEDQQSTQVHRLAQATTLKSDVQLSPLYCNKEQ